MWKKRIILLVIVAIALLPGFSIQEGEESYPESKKTNSPEDDVLIGIMQRTNSMYDKLVDVLQKQQLDYILENTHASNPVKNHIQALAILDRHTLIPLVHNQYVEEYIEAYAIKNPDKISRVLALKEYYFPIFEQYLDRYELPLELKYLAVVESALDPQAVSRSGAVGLWQFLIDTARLLDLEVNSYIDERRDVYKSTEAACRYFEYLYRIFGDWHLVLAAYNGGPGAVEKAIARANGETDYWKIRKYMTGQMKNYVPAFIAINYVMNDPDNYQIQPADTFYNYYQTDTLNVYDQVSFKQIASHTSISVKNLCALNPVYRKAIIPSNPKGNSLILPREDMIAFLLKQDQIYESPVKSETARATQDTAEMTCITHTVQKGESFHKLAIIYNCTIRDILKWNNLSKASPLKYGEELQIYVSDSETVSCR